MESTKVSIIIPSYNGERYLESIIETMIPYYDNSYEIILIDDGSCSTDNTLSEFKKRFPNSICHKQSNQGLAAARNKGANIANGDYLQFLDIDDKISPNKLSTQYWTAILTKADVVFSDWRMVIVDELGSSFPDQWVKSLSQNDYIEALIKGWWNPFHSYLFKRESYFKVGGSNPKLVNAQDFDLVARMAIQGLKFHYHEGKYSDYYRYEKIKSLAKGDRRQYWEDTEIVIDGLLTLLKNRDLLTDFYKEAAAQRLFLIARNVYDFDKNWNRSLIKKTYSFNANFSAKNESKKFQFLFKLFNYNIAERIASIKRTKY